LIIDEILNSCEYDEAISETELLEAISARVVQLLDTDTRLLFSYLYRLDIDEAELHSIINRPSSKPASYRIARLILERQKARLQSKKHHDQGDPIEGWEW